MRDDGGGFILPITNRRRRAGQTIALDIELEFYRSLRRELSAYQRDRSKIRRERETGKRKLRREQCNATVLPEAQSFLGELCLLRGIPKSRAAGNIIEGVLEVWSAYPNDPTMYLRRCPDPWDADCEIDLGRLPDDALQLIPSEDHRFRVSAMAFGIMALLKAGVSRDAIVKEVDRIVGLEQVWR